MRPHACQRQGVVGGAGKGAAGVRAEATRGADLCFPD